MCDGDLDEDCDGEVNEVEDCPCAASPCQNGGACVADGAEYMCDCSETTYAGEHCDEARAVVLPLGPGDSECLAVALSHDGSVVGATCNSRPAYWTANSGWQYLALPNGYNSGSLADLSADGEVFVATLESTSGDSLRAARWSSRNSTGTLLTGGNGDTYARAVSGNGQLAIGDGADGSLLVWTGTSPATPYTEPDDVSASLRAVDFDGSTVWGSGTEEIITWTAPDAATVIDVADVSTVAVTDVSDDGRVAVGLGWTTSGAAAWRLEEGELAWLNSDGAGVCFAYRASADGSRVAGSCNGPIVWLGTNQLDIVIYLSPLAAELAADADIASSQMKAVSGDGTVAIGDDQARVFIVRLPN